MGFVFFKIIKYQLYLLQLESYELDRYFRLGFKKGLLPKAKLRKEVVWTAKAVVLVLLSELLIFGISFFTAWELYVTAVENITAIIVIFLGLVAIFHVIFPLFLTFATLFFLPLVWFVKSVIITRARWKINRLERKVKIIGVAGSYGKTTMKEVIAQVLSSKYQAVWTPESVNTPVGIARWILKEVDVHTEILIVEMGEHYKGDIQDICSIAKPDMSVVTGINEAHLERMGSLQNITDTIFEIVSKSKPRSLVLINGEDKNVVDNYKKYIWPDHRILRFQISDLGFKNFDTEKLVWKVNYENFGEVEINLLGEYALGDVDAAIKIAKELGMSNEEIKKGIEQIKPVDHRLEPIKSANGILVIDDSYNGNPAGVNEAIKVLSRFNGRRKVYITPGLVEIGKATKEVHLEIGKQLAGVADIVILIKNSVSEYIELGILNSELSGPNLTTNHYPLPTILWFNTAEEAHAGLKNIIQPNDVVLFQNDWGDQYI